MPNTFTHPLAVLPFRRLCPARLNFPALVIGSMSPDFAYYIRQFPLASFAHTLLGTLTVCLPTGLVALAIFYLIRRPLCFILPQPHRGALMPLASVQPALTLRSFLNAAASLLLGAWTHTVWDSFTHDGSWLVERISLLRAPVVRFGDTELRVSNFLQHLSTFCGGALLVVVYWLWLRRHREAAAAATDGFSDRQRYWLLALLAAIALAVAVPAAASMASGYHGYLAVRVFVFRMAIYAVAAFVPLFILGSLTVYAVCRKAD